MADVLTAPQPKRALRKAAFAALTALGLVAAAPTSRAIDARLVHPSISRHNDFDINDDRLADAQRRVDDAQRRVDQANANLQQVRGPALDEMEDSPEFRRATQNADAAEDRLNDEIGRVLDRLSQDNPDYRRARARRVASDYIPELRESDDRTAKVDDQIHSLERDALDRDRRVREARADAVDANNAIDALLARYEDRLRDRPPIADAMDRLQAERRALADANADLQDVQGRLAGGAPAGVDDDRYTPPPREVVDTYERDLSPSGRWVDVPNYGRCFVPNGIDRDWRPYTNGHWSHGDDGWAWVADDREASWGEICYHYGRWTHDDRVGWCWVPGTVWAPAWVAWREGGDYSGWAPLPPEGGVTVSAAIADRIPPAYFSFCEDKYLGEPRVREHIVPADRTTTIINKTVNITNVTVVNNRVVNRGVDVARVERVSGHRVQQTQVATASTPVEAQRLRSEGKVVRYEPPVIQKAAEQRIAQHERVAQRAAAEKPAARPGATPANTAAARGNETPGAKPPARANESTGTVATPNAPSATADRAAERERAVERERAARTGTAAKPTDAATPSASANNAERRQSATTRPATPESATATRTERERAARDRTATGTPSASGQPTTPTRATPDTAETARQDRTTAAERDRAARASGTTATPSDSDGSSRRRTATTTPSRESTDTAGRDRSSTPANERDRNARPAGAVIPPSTDRPSERDRSTEPARSRDTPSPAGYSSSRDRSTEATPTPPADETRNSAKDRATERDRPSSTRTPTTAPSAAGDSANTSAHDRAVARERARQPSDSTDKNR